MDSCQTTKRGFTLIELLVVIAIIAILAAILFPVFAQAKQAAKKTAAISNMKQGTLASQMYANDYDDAYMLSDSGSINGSGTSNSNRRLLKGVAAAARRRQRRHQ